MRQTITAVALLVSTLLLGGCLALSKRVTTTVPEVERKVEKALPDGSTREEVEAWLTAQGIKFSFADSTDSPEMARIVMDDIDRYPTAIQAMIFDTNRSFLVTGNISLKFLFGPDGRLQKRVVRWIGTGL